MPVDKEKLSPLDRIIYENWLAAGGISKCLLCEGNPQRNKNSPEYQCVRGGNPDSEKFYCGKYTGAKEKGTEVKETKQKKRFKYF